MLATTTPTKQDKRFANKKRKSVSDIAIAAPRSRSVARIDRPSAQELQDTWADAS